MGVELRAGRATFTGAVCMNLLRHPGWGPAQETYGEDPCHVGEMAAALTRGLQRHVMACMKHFACNSMENSVRGRLAGSEDPGAGLLDRQDVVAGDLELDLDGELFAGSDAVQHLEVVVDRFEMAAQLVQLGVRSTAAAPREPGWSAPQRCVCRRGATAFPRALSAPRDW